MRINSPDKEVDRKESHAMYYFMAFLLGIGAFILLLGIWKTGALAFRGIIKYWMWLLGGVVSLFILKRIVFGKRQRKLRRQEAEE